jgi:hypothetical protein
VKRLRCVEDPERFKPGMVVTWAGRLARVVSVDYESGDVVIEECESAPSGPGGASDG